MGGDDPNPTKPFVDATEPLVGPPRAGANVALTPARVKIGYVYKATGVVNGQKVAYTGSTAQELMGRICKKHARWEFLSAKDTEIEVRVVYARLNVGASGRGTSLSARNEALRTAEQKVMNETAGAGDVVTINDIAAATPENAARWSQIHDVAEGEFTVETAPKWVVRIGEKWVFRGPWLGNAFAILNVFSLFTMYRDAKMSQYVMAPYMLEDEQGVFTLNEEVHLFSANKYWKHYETGPLKDQDVDMTSDEFDFWKEEAHALWGYADWKGDFQPGLFRRSLPTIEVPASSTEA